MLLPQAEHTFRVRFEQAGRAVAMGTVTCSDAPLPPPARDAEPSPTRETNLARLHKQRAENVMVSPLLPTESGGAECRALAPPAHHALAQGAPAAWSLTYLLEVARQSLMLAAHGVLGIPQDKPMNLLAVALSAPRAIHRAEPLVLALAPLEGAATDAPFVADIPIALHTARAAAGTVRLKTQVVDPHTYQEQRWNP